MRTNPKNSSRTSNLRAGNLPPVSASSKLSSPLYSAKPPQKGKANRARIALKGSLWLIENLQRSLESLRTSCFPPRLRRQVLVKISFSIGSMPKNLSNIQIIQTSMRTKTETTNWKTQNSKEHQSHFRKITSPKTDQSMNLSFLMEIPKTPIAPENPTSLMLQRPKTTACF